MFKSLARPLAAAAAVLLSLPGCASEGGPAAQMPVMAGTQATAAIGRTARLGTLAITPAALTEDSRCPANARCIWAGRVVLQVTLQSGSNRDRRQVTLGEPFTVAGRSYALVAAEPSKTTQAATPPGDYRFTFEAR